MPTNTRRILIGLKYFHQCSKNMFADFYFCKVSVWSLSLVYVFVNSTKPILLLLLLLFYCVHILTTLAIFFSHNESGSCLEFLLVFIQFVVQSYLSGPTLTHNEFEILAVSDRLCYRLLSLPFRRPTAKDHWKDGWWSFNSSQSNFNAPVPHL